MVSQPQNWQHCIHLTTAISPDSLHLKPLRKLSESLKVSTVATGAHRCHTMLKRDRGSRTDSRVMTSTVNACIEYYLPTDARHWIPNGVAFADLQIDSEIAENAGDSDWYDAIEFAAEEWCDATHGKGSYFRVIFEP